MKSPREFRTITASEDAIRKANKLEPIKKNGKERHQMLDQIDDDLDIDNYKKRESILDYFDDGEEKE